MGVVHPACKPAHLGADRVLLTRSGTVAEDASGSPHDQPGNAADSMAEGHICEIMGSSHREGKKSRSQDA